MTSYYSRIKNELLNYEITKKVKEMQQYYLYIKKAHPVDGQLTWSHLN